MYVSDLTRDGKLKISFDQNMLVPDFVNSNSDEKRILTELSELDATQFFEAKIVVQSEERKSDLNYFY